MPKFTFDVTIRDRKLSNYWWYSSCPFNEASYSTSNIFAYRQTFWQSGCSSFLLKILWIPIIAAAFELVYLIFSYFLLSKLLRKYKLFIFYTCIFCLFVVHGLFISLSYYLLSTYLFYCILYNLCKS